MTSSEPVRRLAELRRMTGTWFFAVAFIARMPVAMNVVGVLTLVTVVRGSVADAGLVSASLGIAFGLGGPLAGAIADRVGQRPVLVVGALLHAAALAVLLVAVYAHLPLGWIMLAGVFAGLTIPPASPLTRARWLALLDDDTRRGGRGVSLALGYESMADEISFVGGPVLVGALATVVGPAAPIVGAAIITVVFVIAFAVHPTATNVHAAAATGMRIAAPRRELVRARVLLPLVGMLAMGAFFGSTLAALTEFMEQTGQGESTGLIYGVMGATSAAAALLVGRLPARFSLVARWGVGALVLLVGGIGLALSSGLGGIVAALTVLGVAVGATLVTLFTLGADAAPAGRLSTTMTMLSGGITIGQGMTVAVVGAVAASFGASAGFAWVAGAGALGLLAALAFLITTRLRHS